MPDTPPAGPTEYRTDVAKLTALRQAAGLSIRKLAAASTVSDSYLRDVHRHRRHLGPSAAPRVAKALGCKVEDFTYYGGTPQAVA